MMSFSQPSVQSLSHVRLFVTPWTAARKPSLSNINSWSLLKLMSIESVMLSNHLTLHRPILLTLIFPSIRDFSKRSALGIRWPERWSFSFCTSLSNEYSGLFPLLLGNLSGILTSISFPPSPQQSKNPDSEK